ncbi:MAG: Cyclic nucleotide-binding domain [Solirubrobacteraceae bacterium]|nr:Cyclic nucleotide-binding domain [Solirubrobacteraceae bacterium]
MPIDPAAARGFGPFEALSDDELAVAARAVDAVGLAPGDALYHQGETGTSAFVVISGDVETRNAGHGAELEHVSVAPGTVLGQIGLLIDHSRPASVVARGHAEAWEITREAFQAALDRRDAWVAWFLFAAAKGLAERLEAATAQLVSTIEACAGGGEPAAAQVAELDALRRRLSGIWSF